MTFMAVAILVLMGLFIHRQSTPELAPAPTPQSQTAALEMPDSGVFVVDGGYRGTDQRKLTVTTTHNKGEAK